jgi:hypothetical protein
MKWRKKMKQRFIVHKQKAGKNLFEWEKDMFLQFGLSALFTLLAQIEGHESVLKSSLRLFLFPNVAQ